MGFLTTQDRIGNVSYSSGIITLQPSLLTIGGQQYRTPTLNVALSGLTANTLYMVYVVMTGPTSFQLVVSGSFNSAGPNGYNRWKLVDAFYADSASSVGSFIKSLTSSPETDVFSYTPSVTFLANVTTVNGKVFRKGSEVSASIFLVFSGTTTTANLRWNYLSQMPIATSKLAATSSYVTLGFGEIKDSSAGSLALGIRSIYDLNTSNAGVLVNGTGGSYSAAAGVTNTIPITIDSGDSLSLSMSYPVSGWSNTPIAYL